jgi:hypothetical protein
MAIKLNPCKVCGNVPKIGYACGEHFVIGNDQCPRCKPCGEWKDVMRASEISEIRDWNVANPVNPKGVLTNV